MLSLRPGRLRLSLALLISFSSLAVAQRPSPELAQELLSTRPDLAAQLRQRIMTSGMTADQIRSRLQSEGYPADMLDSYLPGGLAGAGMDSTTIGSAFSAILALGITDSTDAYAMQLRNTRRFPLGRRDSRRLGQGSICDTSYAITQSIGPTVVSAGSAASLGSRAPRMASNTGDTIRAVQAQPCFEREQNPSLRDDEMVISRPRLPKASGMRLGKDSIADSSFEFSEQTIRDVERRREAQSYEIFGLDVFQRQTSQFDPNLSGPVDETYRLGPGDRLVLVLTGDVEAAYALDVTREGFVVIPRVGQVDVANLTLGQFEDVLYSRLGKVYSGIRRGGGATTRFSISPARLRSNQVYVIGDVAQPGSYRVSGAGTVLTALYAAGGPTTAGSLRSIEVRRGSRPIARVDLYDYLLHGDASHDVRLENGDVVFVPVHGSRVRVAGEVVRPGTYELKEGDQLGDVLGAAGGFTARAGRRRVQIERIVPPSARSQSGHDRTLIDVSSDQLGSESGPALAMEAGDVVRAFPVAERVRNRVAVRGNVWTPGNVGFTPGMRVSEAIRLAGGVKPDVYLAEILVSRLESDSTRVQLRTSFRDTTGAITNDFPLTDDDEIQVFSVTEFRPTRYVAISGAVRKPGRFPFREGMTMRDLVLMAGGLQEKALLEAAEIARLPETRTAGRLATTMRVPLDSTYLFERGPDGKYLGPPGLAVQQGHASEVQLKPYDNVLILEQPEWALQRTVVVTGEVKFPGTYSLMAKNERVADVLKRAGGLTTEGFADGVYFVRRKGAIGRIGIDLPRVLRDTKNPDNLILQDGDSINVPQYTATVLVGGAVNAPVAVSYVPGEDIDFYIRAAGGLNQKAAGARSFVTQPNGKVESREHHMLWPDGKPHPRPGSTVFVPEKDPTDKKTDFMQSAGTLAQILVSLVGIVAIMRR